MAIEDHNKQDQIPLPLEKSLADDPSSAENLRWEVIKLIIEKVLEKLQSSEQASKTFHENSYSMKPAVNYETLAEVAKSRAFSDQNKIFGLSLKEGDQLRYFFRGDNGENRERVNQVIDLAPDKWSAALPWKKLEQKKRDNAAVNPNSKDAERVIREAEEYRADAEYFAATAEVSALAKKDAEGKNVLQLEGMVNMARDAYFREKEKRASNLAQIRFDILREILKEKEKSEK